MEKFWRYTIWVGLAIVVIGFAMFAYEHFYLGLTTCHVTVTQDIIIILCGAAVFGLSLHGEKLNETKKH